MMYRWWWTTTSRGRSCWSTQPGVTTLVATDLNLYLDAWELGQRVQLSPHWLIWMQVK